MDIHIGNTESGKVEVTHYEPAKKSLALEIIAAMTFNISRRLEHGELHSRSQVQQVAR